MFFLPQRLKSPETILQQIDSNCPNKFWHLRVDGGTEISHKENSFVLKTRSETNNHLFVLRSYRKDYLNGFLKLWDQINRNSQFFKKNLLSFQFLWATDGNAAAGRRFEAFVLFYLRSSDDDVVWGTEEQTLMFSINSRSSALPPSPALCFYSH